MKELSIEEKAERYDKAIERAKNFIENGDEGERTIAESIFAGFMEESEDEEIRKEIIDIIDSYDVYHLKAAGLPSRIPEYIAWLEKQAEQKPAEWTMDNIEELTEFETAMMHIGGSFFGEHQGLDPNDTNAIKEQANILSGLVAKQEWSEEDKCNLSDIEAMIHTMRGGGLNAERLIDWLKSLRPQKQWKPSDNELEVLRLAAEKDGTCLMGLYKQLKKLREE